MKITNLLFAIFLFFLAMPCHSQNELREAKKKNILKNFENVTSDPLTGKVYYEQRLYRNPFKGMLEIRKALSDTALKEFIPLFQGVEIGTFLSGENVKYRITENSGSQKLLQSFPLHLKRYKLDFWVQPVIAANFGYREQPFQSNASLLLQTQFYIWKGLVLNAGILFPVSNDLDNRPKKVRPAPVFLNQFLAFGKNYISASAGYFYNDQYGLNVQYRHADLAGPWSFGLETGLTGIYYYPQSGVYYEPMDKLLLLADVAYRLSEPDLTFRLSGGRYLAGDNGARVDFIRQFANVEAGLYIMKTGNGTTAGFNFAIPIPPGKILQGKHVRLRTTDEFRWEYSYTRGFRIGERYRTGYQLDQKLRQYHVNYLNRQIQK